MKLKTIGNGFIIFIFLATKIWAVMRRVIPLSLEVQEGEDMQLRLLTSLIGEVSCYVRTPWLENINLKIEEHIPEDDRIQYWSENNRCGVKVRNVRKEDEGWWRLTSKNNSNQTIVDAVNVKILDKVSSIENQMSILTGLEYHLTLAHGSKFCKVTHPSFGHEAVEIVEEDCKIDLKKPTGANAGRWIADVGIKGKIEEIPAIANVIISPQEYLDFGYKKEGSFLHLYCNLLNYDDEPDLCRFTQVNQNRTAFQPAEGLRKGRFGYYGNGLAERECGLTIENPKKEDLGTWHCLIGKIGENVLGAYIIVENNNLSKRAFNNQGVPKSVRPVITTLSKELIVQCSADVPLRYCWFSGPNDTILTPIDYDVGFYR